MRRLAIRPGGAWLPHGRRGTSTLEFALAAPILITVLLAIVDLGRAMDQTIRLETATRAGAQYALSFPEDTGVIGQRVTEALAGQTGLHAPEVTIGCICPAASAGGAETPDPGCVSTCTGRQRLLSIAVAQDFTGFMFTSTRRLHGHVVLRLQ